MLLIAQIFANLKALAYRNRLFLGIALSHAYATSYAMPYISLTPAIAKSIDGTNLSELKVGQQILIETNVTNSGIKLDKPLVATIEVRDNDGITKHLAWQSMNLGVGDKSEIGISWLVPDNAQSGDTCLIRCLAIDSVSDHSQSLSNVFEAKVTVG